MELANNILAVIEPKIRPTEIKIDALGEEKPDEATVNQTSVIATLKPMVLINGYQFTPQDITFFELDLSQILPTCKLSLNDSAGKFAVGSYPRDGDFFTILINSKNQETFKSIHMDFDIASCDSPKDGTVGTGSFNIEGFCKIPKIYGEDCKHFENGTSLDHMKLVSADLELGLATNIDAADDSQVRIMAYEPYLDFIKNIVKESYVGEESFQKFWVDAYYYLNYVDVNALFNSPNPPILEFAESLASAAESMTPTADDKKNAETGNDIEVPLMLTNHIKFMGNNAFIEAHEIINNSAEISAKAGYAREVTIYDNNGDKKKQEFRIEPLGGKDLKELEEPLRGNRNDKRHLDQIKYKYIGRQEAGEDGLGNVHSNAAFAQLHNTQNAMEVQKMKLKVTLNSFNPSLYKYQKIPVLMYIVNPKAIEQNERIKGDKKELGMDKDEPFNLGEDTESIAPERSPSNALDTFLSGYYIIEDIVYSTSDGETKQYVTLLRREWPTRTENLINPPGLAEDATPKKKAENIKENSPAPPPPEPTPAPTPEVELDIQITMPSGTFEQDVTSAALSQNVYVIFEGKWTANKEVSAFDDWSAEIDGTSLDSGSGVQLKKDGRIIIDGSGGLGALDPKTYTLEITIKAEGKTFTKSGEVTIKNKASEFKYSIQQRMGMGTKYIKVFKGEELIYTGDDVDKYSPKQTMIDFTINKLKAEYPGVEGMQNMYSI